MITVAGPFALVGNLIGPEAVIIRVVARILAPRGGPGVAQAGTPIGTSGSRLRRHERSSI